MRILLAGLAGLVVAGGVVGSPAAAAGDGVLRTDPADGGWSRLVPGHVRLWFTDERSAAAARVLLLTPGAAAAQTVRSRTAGAVVTVAVPDDGPGSYRVIWVVGGPDGGAAGAATFRVGGALPAFDGGPAALPIIIPRIGRGPGDGVPGPVAARPSGAASRAADDARTRPGAAAQRQPAVDGAGAPLPPPPGPRPDRSRLLLTALAGLAAFAAAARWSVRHGERLALRGAAGQHAVRV